MKPEVVHQMLLELLTPYITAQLYTKMKVQLQIDYPNLQDCKNGSAYTFLHDTDKKILHNKDITIN